MKKFIKAAAVFMLPVLLIIGVFFAALWRTGELGDTKSVYEAEQNGTMTQFGFAYRDNTRALKHEIASAKAADLLVLSTSRGMQFRGEFFATDSFYNAGGGIAFATQAQYFLETMPKESLPTHLLLVLDQYFYNEDWANIDDNRDTEPYEYTKPGTWYMLRRSMEDYLDGKYSLLSALSEKSGVYGLSAAVRGAGFYADGSYSYGAELENPARSVDEKLADSLNRISLSTNRFEYGDTVNAVVLERTGQLLDFCKQNNIAVTAIIPPYAPTVWRTMQQSGQYTYIEKLGETLTQLFDGYGYEVFDYTSMDDTADAQYIDGFHGGSSVYAQICLRLAESSQLLSSYIDTDACNAFLQKYKAAL
ncbi:MAG: hypothetical protein EOM30_12530 [Clostridia bacterium]|nr:hypothetical protein [Clostridia bacterium]NLS84244.1 hypothetical protein [Oscillospiraceae bacterium]